MPYKITQVSRNNYSVSNKETGKIHAYHTSKANAQAQVRLLHGLEHGTLTPRKK